MSVVVWPHRISPLVSGLAERLALPDVHEAEPESVARALPASGRSYRIVMAGGGTGGHLYPGLAVAEALREKLGDRVTLVWAATPRPVDQRLLAQYGENYVRQNVQPLVKKITRLWGFYNGWMSSCAYWKRYFRDNQVDAVLALGGYAAGPASYVASQQGIPVGMLNPDAVPGLANRFLLKRSNKVFAQWSLDGAKEIAGRVMAIGCPIRRSLLGRTRDEGMARLGLSGSLKTLVITGASLGARTINDAMCLMMKDETFRKALGGWQVIHLTGMEQAEAVKAAYGDVRDVPVKVMDYCDDMASVWAVADVAIARAGASTCAELTACGVPAILMPYPYHKDMHQRHNAMKLVEAGAALLVDDAKEAAKNAEVLRPVLAELLTDNAQRADMAAAARQVGKPNASRDIAEQLIEMVEAKA